MAAASVDVIRGQLVRSIHGQLVAARTFEEHWKLRDLLEPVHDLVLGDRLVNGCADRTAPEDEDHNDQQHSEEGGKSKEVGVKEAQEHHPDQSPKDHIHAVEQ